MNKGLLIVVLSMVLLAAAGCQKTPGPAGDGSAPGLTVITTLFPLYDFTRAVGGDKVAVTLLLPPGVEPHAFEPKPMDHLRLAQADVFIFTNRYMEPWADKLVRGTDNKDLVVVDAGKGISFMDEPEGHDHGRHAEKKHEHNDKDPHIWLDLRNAAMMVDTIAGALSRRDPANGAFYMQNALAFKKRLLALDRMYEEGLGTCPQKVFINGGHFAFGYLAQRYHLTYLSAYGASPDAEPSPRDLIALSKLMKQKGLRHIFYEELIMPRIAETIGRETGARLLLLHGAHNISREDLDAGVTFITIMERNLDQLRTGLQCPRKP